MQCTKGNDKEQSILTTKDNIKPLNSHDMVSKIETWEKKINIKGKLENTMNEMLITYYEAT